MHIIEANNVNDAYQRGMRLLLSEGTQEDTRNGGAVVMPVPVVNVYRRPCERVLFDAQRNANPFFHMVEAVWMIAGRNDATLLDRYVSDFSKRFAEDDGLAHGAYGHRWRNHFGRVKSGENEHGVETSGFEAMDQLKEAGRLLRENPASRQVVLAMWDPVADLGAKKRDIPCNDLVMFRAVDGKLNMTIIARSHDAVWGAYGANIVHMSVMFEVVAALADMEVGTYTHFSNNFHIYDSVLGKVGEFPRGGNWPVDPYHEHVPERICRNQKEAEQFIAECELFCDQLADPPKSKPFKFKNEWLSETVVPMVVAHSVFKNDDHELAMDMVSKVKSTDWRQAGQEWLARRISAIQQRRAEQDVN